jgi:CRISPR/Cas system-associated exonuclease Cas4 (RecB family)
MLDLIGIHQTKGVFMNINHISVSRKKCFDLCQQQYKYRYHLKLDSPVEKPFYFVYGTIVHKIAELYVEGKGERPIGEIAQEVICGKVPIEGDKLCPPIPQDYQKKLQKHLRAIQNLTERIGANGIVEYEFKYDLDPPNNKCVTGFIDRLIIKGEGDGRKAFIIDYKTTKKGKFRVNTDTIKEDIQLRMYARVVQREFSIHPDNIKAALFYLDGENLIGAQFCEEDLIETERMLRETFYQIERVDPDKVWGNVGWHCKNCDYATICPFYKSNATQDGESKWDGDLVQLGHSDDAWGD